jgi:hypothetical protein
LLQYHKIKTSSWGEFFDTVAAVNIKINGSWRALFLYTAPEKSSLQVCLLQAFSIGAHFHSGWDIDYPD